MLSTTEGEKDLLPSYSTVATSASGLNSFEEQLTESLPTTPSTPVLPAVGRTAVAFRGSDAVTKSSNCQSGFSVFHEEHPLNSLINFPMLEVSTEGGPVLGPIANSILRTFTDFKTPVTADEYGWS